MGDIKKTQIVFLDWKITMFKYSGGSINGKFDIAKEKISKVKLTPIESNRNKEYIGGEKKI